MPLIVSRDRRRTTGALTRLLAAGALLLALLVPARAHAEIGIVAGEEGDSAAVAQVERLLDREGIEHHRLNDRRLTDRTLRQYDAIVLPGSQLSGPASEALQRFEDRGGRWVAYGMTVPPAAEARFGLKTAAAPLPATLPRALLPNPLPGVPGHVPVPAGTQFRNYVPAQPALEGGRWDVETELASLVRGPNGYYVNALPGTDSENARLLLALLGDLDPTVWGDALTETRFRALSALRDAANRWTAARGRPEFTNDQRARIESALQSLRRRVPDPDVPNPDLENNRVLLADRIEAGIELLDQIQRVSYQMTPSRKGEVRGIWIQPSARQDWDGMMHRIRDAGLNTVFVKVAQGGSTIYPSEVLPISPWAKGAPDELATAIEAAHKYSLAFHAWRVDFDLSGAEPEYRQKAAADDRLAKDAQGKTVDVLNPGDPRNAEQEFQAVMEVVKKYDLDGLHFDFLRYPEQPHLDWDYGAVSRREFEKASGKPVEKWPADVISGGRRLEYDEWERGNINRLVQRAYDEIKKVKPWVQVSAMVGRSQRSYRSTVKQDWPRWVEEGWVDFLVPADFSTQPDVVAADADAQVSAVHGKVPLVVGLAGSLSPNPVDLLRQIEAVRDSGADGFCIYSYDGDGMEELLTALRSSATAEGTWPAYLAPRAEWTLGPFLFRKDAPYHYLLGDRVALEVRISPTAPFRLAVKTFTAEVRLEDPVGGLIDSLGPLVGPKSLKTRFEVPAGRFRPVIRGSVTLSDGSTRPFVTRGPLCDGLAPEELAALRAQDVPPTIPGNGRKVAVYAGAAGARALLDVLGADEAFSPFLLYHLQADFLARADVLILPQTMDVAELTPESQDAIRQWVIAGGTLILLQDAVGARWHPRMFPEIGVGDSISTERDLVFSQALGSFQPGETLQLNSPEHVRITPAGGAQVILREAGANGAPVAVTGKVGKGQVLLYGGSAGADGRDLSAEERGFLWTAVRGKW